MEEGSNLTVPYIVHEGVQVRLERTIKRLVFALIITILLMFATNALWIWSWMQYDYESEDFATTTTNTVDVDGHNGVATYIGDIINGADSRDLNSNNDSQAQAETEEEWQKQGNP